MHLLLHSGNVILSAYKWQLNIFLCHVVATNRVTKSVLPRLTQASVDCTVCACRSSGIFMYKNFMGKISY